VAVPPSQFGYSESAARAIEPHRLAELRSLAYHAEIAARLSRGEVDVARALARVRRMRERELAGETYLDAWERLLTGPRDALCTAIVRDDEEMRALRQSTPFTGVLQPAERLAIWRRVRQEAESGVLDASR